MTVRKRTLRVFWSLAPPVASLVTEPLVTARPKPGSARSGAAPAHPPRAGAGAEARGGAMASPHRAARQAAASLHLPVNLTTGARGAQYEHEDPFESLVAAALAAAVEEEQKGMRPARASVMWEPGRG